MLDFTLLRYLIKNESLCDKMMSEEQNIDFLYKKDQLSTSFLKN